MKKLLCLICLLTTTCFGQGIHIVVGGGGSITTYSNNIFSVNPSQIYPPISGGTVNSNSLSGQWNYSQIYGVPSFLTTVNSNNIFGQINYGQIYGTPNVAVNSNSFTGQLNYGQIYGDNSAYNATNGFIWGTLYDSSGAAFASTNGYPWGGLYDPVNAAKNATNTFVGTVASMIGTATNGNFDAAGLAVSKAHDATNGFPWGVLYDAAGASILASNAVNAALVASNAPIQASIVNASNTVNAALVLSNTYIQAQIMVASNQSLTAATNYAANANNISSGSINSNRISSVTATTLVGVVPTNNLPALSAMGSGIGLLGVVTNSYVPQLTLNGAVLSTNGYGLPPSTNNIVPPANGFTLSTAIIDTNRPVLVGADETNVNSSVSPWVWNSFTNAYTNALGYTMTTATNKTGAYAGDWIVVSNLLYVTNSTPTNVALYIAPTNWPVGLWFRSTNYTGGGGTNGSQSAPYGSFAYTNNGSLNVYASSDGTNQSPVVSVESLGPNGVFPATNVFSVNPPWYPQAPQGQGVSVSSGLNFILTGSLVSPQAQIYTPINPLTIQSGGLIYLNSVTYIGASSPSQAALAVNIGGGGQIEMPNNTSLRWRIGNLSQAPVSITLTNQSPGTLQIITNLITGNGTFAGFVPATNGITDGVTNLGSGVTVGVTTPKGFIVITNSAGVGLLIPGY